MGLLWKALRPFKMRAGNKGNPGGGGQGGVGEAPSTVGGCGSEAGCVFNGWAKWEGTVAALAATRGRRGERVSTLSTRGSNDRHVRWLGHGWGMVGVWLGHGLGYGGDGGYGGKKAIFINIYLCEKFLWN